MRNKYIVFLLIILIAPTQVMVNAEESYGLLKTIEQPEGETDSYFGCAIRFTETHIIIGDKDYPTNDIRAAGKVYIFTQDGTHVNTIQSDEPKRDGKYGAIVEVKDDKIIVVEMEYGFTVKGISKIFFYDQQYSQTEVWSTSDPELNVFFGNAIAFQEDRILISEPAANSDVGVDTGVVQVFDDAGSHIGTLTSENQIVSANFGVEMVADESVIVVSELFGVMDMKDYKRGVVHLFDNDWNHISTLSAPNPGSVDLFGSSLALGDEFIYIGDKNAEVDGEERAGEVYVFDKTGVFVKSISAESPVGGAYFGASLAFDDGLLVVGEPSVGVSVVVEGLEEFRVQAGRVHVFDGESVLVDSFSSEVPLNRGFFGDSVACYGDRVYVGESGSNAIHIFEFVINDDPEVPPDGIFPWGAIYSVIFGLSVIVLWLVYKRARL